MNWQFVGLYVIVQIGHISWFICIPFIIDMEYHSSYVDYSLTLILLEKILGGKKCLFKFIQWLCMLWNKIWNLKNFSDKTVVSNMFWSQNQPIRKITIFEFDKIIIFNLFWSILMCYLILTIKECIFFPYGHYQYSFM